MHYRNQNKVFLISLIFLFMITQKSSASNRLSLGGFACLGIPIEPDKLITYWKPGQAFGGELIYRLFRGTDLIVRYSNQIFHCNLAKKQDEIEIDLGYRVFKLWDGNAKYQAIHILVKQVTAPARFAVVPYLIAGIGYYDMHYRDLIALRGNQIYIPIDYPSRTDYGLCAGLGLRFRISRWTRAYAETNFHYILTEPKKTEYLSAFMGLRVILPIPI